MNFKYSVNFSAVKLAMITLFAMLCIHGSAVFAQNSSSVNCETDNAALQAMPNIEVTLSRTDGSSYSFGAKLANNLRTRAAGFQRVCASTIAATPILFEFQREQTPSFHMNNVVAPLDIAFIDKQGDIDSIQLMKVYSILQVTKPLYSSKGPVLYALEAHPGFFEKHDISLTSTMTWAAKDLDN